VTLLLRLTYARYLAASIGALGIDVATFMIALNLMPASLAAGAGYCTGIAAHWLLSSRAVFSGRLAQTGAPRTQQLLLFLASALIGLALTMAIVGLGAALGLHPWIAKCAAIVISFQVTYTLRRKVVFA